MRTTRHPLLALVLSVGAVAATACTADDPTAAPDDAAAGVDDVTDQDGDVDVPLEDTSGSTDQSGTTTTTATGGAGNGGRGRSAGLRLAPFADCSEFLDHVKQQARDRVGPYGLDPYGNLFHGVPVEESASDLAGGAANETMTPAATFPASADQTSSTRAAADDDSGSSSTSGDASVKGTNTQEEGVDEPDIVKTDGNRIITVIDNVLTYVDISSGEPVVTGTLRIPDGWGHQLFLVDDRAVLLTNGGSWPTPLTSETAAPADDTSARSSMPAVGSASVIEVDLSIPSELRIAATLRIEGQYLNARAIGDRLLLASSTGPQWMPWLYPQTQSGEQRAEEANRALIDDSTLADWVPQFELTIEGGATTTGDLLGCEQLQHPVEFSGFEVISVIELDMAAGLADGYSIADASGVLAAGQTVYASLDRFYVATNRWASTELVDDNGIQQWTENYTTDLHSFVISAGEPLRYVASGSIDGSLLNSFSLDEHEGYLRVLSTDGTPWNQGDLSETSLTVLAEQDEQLVPVGHVGGLGKGEALYSARLIGDRGFAVTFRQVDPFYVLDLSDPAAPTVTGELKIPGFSTYLHPVGEHRVLGVGRDATEHGQVLGFKLSLFDVSDPGNPAEISTWTLPNAGSPAEYDHHAFQMIGSTAILPIDAWDQSFSGAVVFDIGDSITELGRISHVPDATQPTSDCRELDDDDVTDQSSPLYWYAVDTFNVFQLCGANDQGGYGDWACETIAIDDIDTYWGADVSDELRSIDQDVDRVETCWSQGNYAHAIQRSMIVDDTLWTLSPTALWAHDLATLSPIAHASI